MYSDYKRKGITLLKKGQKGIVHALFSRFGLILLLFLVQDDCIGYICGGPYHST